MNAAMKNPVFYQGSLFIIQGYDVLLYAQPIIDGNFSADFVKQDYFLFEDPVETIEVKPIGLVVTTSKRYFVIAGGPNTASYYLTFLHDRVGGYVLSEDGGSFINDHQGSANIS